VVVLKRLTDAMRDGDNILALIRGSAVNQDGRSNGLAAPNLMAQQAVQRQALANAGVEPAQIGFIETHGTGTALGDPIEVEALAAVYGQPRLDGAACLLGAVKTNIGHLEGAAGVAGLIKVVLSLQHGAIPPNLNFRRLNPNITLTGTRIALPTRLTGWTAGEQPRRAAISSFGFGGTNAHIILEESRATSAPPPYGPPRPLDLLLLSGKTPAGLRALAGCFADLLTVPQPPAWPDICFSANTGRASLPYRVAVIADAYSASGLLKAFAAGNQAEGVLSGNTAVGKPPKVAFLFTGQGGQYARMSRQLYNTHPAFRADVDRCADLLRSELGINLTEVIFAEPGSPAASRLDGPELAQPALFALEWALARFWMSLGVRPFALLGHSLGELVAACIADVLSLEDALRLVAVRGRLLHAAPPGAMAAIFADAAVIQAALERVAVAPESIGIAALNGPAETVISGTTSSVEALLVVCAAQGVLFKRLPADHAYHSPLLQSASSALAREAAGIRFSPARLPIVSSLTGALVAPDDLADPGYWARQLMAPVQFAPALAALLGLGVTALIEVGPHPTLLGLAQQAHPDAFLALPSLRRDGDDWRHLLSSLGRLAVAGGKIDWRVLDEPYSRRRVALPSYPFQRQRHWLAHAVPTAPPRLDALVSEPALQAPLPAATERPIQASKPLIFTQVAAAASGERQRLIRGYLRQRIARALHAEADTIGDDRNLTELGTDSLMMIDVLNDCKSNLRVALYPREFYERPSLRELAEYVAAEFERVHGPADAAPTPGVEHPSAVEPAWAVSLPAPLSGPAPGLAGKNGGEPTEQAGPGVAEIAMEESFVEVRGMRLCVCAWGPPEGQPVLCLHGMLDHGASWERVGAALARRGLRVIAPDLRGHGRSEHVSRGSAYHLIDILGDIDGLVGSLGQCPLTLVGHSLGAALAGLIAIARPQRIARLVLVEPPPLPALDGRQPIERLAQQLDSLAERPSHPTLPDVRAAAERLQRSMPALSEAWALRMAERLTEPVAGGVRWRWDATLRTRAGLVFDGAFTTAKAGELLSRLATPVVLIYGDGEDSAAARAPAAFSLPGARRVSLHGGHALHIDAPEELAEWIAGATA
jgi:acyl transferase domain-containing protein